MKYYVILVAVLIVVAGMIFFAYYENSLNERKLPSGSHVYLGAIYSGTPTETNFISATVTFNEGINLNDSIYYVVLSVWDSNESYDQIGISSLNGHFYATYSYTEMINGSIKYIFDPSWFPIRPGTHVISMYINSTSRNLTFTFDNKSHNAYTGGYYFRIKENEPIGNHSFSGLTVYEEIYGFNKSLPGISFNFSRVNYGTTGYPTGSITDWVRFSHNLTAVYNSTIYISGGSVNITNVLPHSQESLNWGIQQSYFILPYGAVINPLISPINDNRTPYQEY
jgi:hypothetical protein